MSRFLATFILLLAVSASAQERPKAPETRVTLNAALEAALKQRYPGYRLAQKSDYPQYITEDEPEDYGPDYRWSYSALEADFNGDGFNDYSLFIRYKLNFRWIIAMKNGDSYKLHDLGQPYVPYKGERVPKTSKWVGMRMTIGPVCGMSEDYPYMATVDWSEYPISTTWKVPLNPFPYIRLWGDGDAIETYWKNGRWNTSRFID